MGSTGVETLPYSRIIVAAAAAAAAASLLSLYVLNT
jgi:hypothetical protein